MSKRYEWINGETYCDSDQMYDNETGNKTQPVYVADLLNEQDQKIKDLEHRLSNCIEPKYKLNQDVFVIIQKVVRKTNISSIRIFEGYEFSYYCKYVDNERMYLELDENEIFLTEAEAKAKLRSLEDDSL